MFTRCKRGVLDAARYGVRTSGVAPRQTGQPASVMAQRFRKADPALWVKATKSDFGDFISAIIAY